METSDESLQLLKIDGAGNREATEFFKYCR
jgi:hypothetical protein